MATTVKRIETLEIDLEPKPGAWGKVFNALRDAGVGVHACWAFEIGPEMAKGILYTSDNAKAREVFTKLGKKTQANPACWAEGEDALGVYADLLAKISDAGINLHASDAFGVGGKFVTVFFPAPKDAESLCKVLGC